MNFEVTHKNDITIIKYIGDVPTISTCEAHLSPSFPTFHYVKHLEEKLLMVKEDSAEKILFENLIGVNKIVISKHHDFLPSVLKAMKQHAIVHNKHLENKVAELTAEKMKLQAAL